MFILQKVEKRQWPQLRRMLGLPCYLGIPAFVTHVWTTHTQVPRK